MAKGRAEEAKCIRGEVPQGEDGHGMGEGNEPLDSAVRVSCDSRNTNLAEYGWSVGIEIQLSSDTAEPTVSPQAWRGLSRLVYHTPLISFLSPVFWALHTRATPSALGTNQREAKQRAGVHTRENRMGVNSPVSTASVSRVAGAAWSRD